MRICLSIRYFLPLPLLLSVKKPFCNSGQCAQYGRCAPHAGPTLFQILYTLSEARLSVSQNCAFQGLGLGVNPSQHLYHFCDLLIYHCATTLQLMVLAVIGDTEGLHTIMATVSLAS